MHIVSAISINSFFMQWKCFFECIDDWKKLSETSLPKKADFYSGLNMEDGTDTYYRNGKRICKNCKIKNFGKYPESYVWRNGVLSVNIRT